MNWVVHKYYYIINFRNFIRPRIYPVYFVNRTAAKRAIAANFPSKKNRAFYEVIRGDKLKEFEATHVFSLGKLRKFTKYTYPDHVKTIQQRKTFRTVMRRRLRRMGMLTLVKSKSVIGNDPQIVKLIKNRQQVADSPNTLAKVFRLERKAASKFYVIIKKEISKEKGVLMRVKVIGVDIKTHRIKKEVIRIRRKDVIIPYLLTELLDIYGKGNRLLDLCREEGIRVN